MGFSVNHAEAREYTVLPEGEYEVIIQRSEVGKTKNGSACVNLNLVIRNDCDQKHQNYTIFDSLYKRKEPTQADLSVEGFSFKQIQALSKAAGLPDGKSYADISEWAADLTGKLLNVTVYHEDYNGKKYARIRWRNQTKQPNCKHVWKPGLAATSKAGFTEMPDDDDDAPF